VVPASIFYNDFLYFLGIFYKFFSFYNEKQLDILIFLNQVLHLFLFNFVISPQNNDVQVPVPAKFAGTGTGTKVSTGAGTKFSTDTGTEVSTGTG
jgi:hypothetical protein